jgi:uncharacterized protein YecT (DUF1311 family)
MFARISGRKIGWTLALSISFACFRPAECADEATLLRQIRNADLQLNEDYKTVLRALSKSGQERLRVAERAWLAFITKNEEAVAGMAGARSATTVFLLQLRLTEIRYRSAELRAMLGEQPATLRSMSLVGGQADVELNKVYQNCLGMLSHGHIQRLREAQRAWLDFRDKHIIASSGTSRAPVAVPASTLLPLHRLTSLKAIYLDETPVRAQVVQDKRNDAINSSIPDPFATAR